MTTKTGMHKILVILPTMGKPAFARCSEAAHPIEWLEAASLDEAKRFLSEVEFDFAVVDADNMTLDFRQCVRFIKSQRPEARVVVVAEIGDDDLWLEALNAGACDLVEKPLQERYLERLCHPERRIAAA